MGLGAHEELVEDPEVPLPDNGDAVENRYEQHALRKYPGRHEVDVAHVSRRDGANAREDLAEDQEPQSRLNCAREKLGRVMEELARLHPRNGERPPDVAGEPEKKVRPAKVELSRDGEPACVSAWFHGMYLLNPDCCPCSG